jgi:hypothetical protein
MALMMLVGTSSAWAYCASAYIATWDGSSNKQVKLYDGCNLLAGISSSYSDGITYEVGSTFGIDFYVITDHSTDYSNGKVYYSINGGTTQSGQLNRNGDYSGKRRYSFYLDIAATDATKLDVWITVPNSDNNWKLDNDKQYTFNFTRQSSGEDCTTDDTEIRVEFKKPSDWTKPYIWAWVEGGSNFTGGKWPGKEMDYDSETGYYYYVIDRGNTSTNQTVNVIFSNNGNNQKSTISGLKWSKVYKYDKDGKQEDEDCLPPSCFTINDLDITASKTTICDGESVTLTLNNKQSGVTYKIGNTTIFNSNVAKPTYNTGAITGVLSKSYTIEATATGQCEAKTKTIEIAVNSIPATPTFNDAPSYCAGNNITLPTTDEARNSVTWYEEDKDTPVVTPATAAGTYTYYAKATNTSGCVSADFGTYSYTVKERATKANLTVTDNVHTYDGTAKAATVKWKDNQSAEGITVTYNPTTPKDAGSYTINVTTSAHGELCASNGAITLYEELTISPKTPDANDFEYTDQKVTYNGNAQTATVTWKQGYDKTGAITITYKQGDEVKDPINAGIYDVWVTSAASDNFKATESKINKGTLTINLAKITDVPSNFQLSKTSYNYGEEAKPTVSLKQGSSLIEEGLGDITPIYYNSQNEVVAEPTEVGTYTVKITMTEGNGYRAITEPTVVGTFEIVCPDFAEPELIQNESVKRCNGQTIEGGKGSIKVNNYESVYKGKGYTFLVDGTEVSISEDGVLSKEIDIDNSKSEQEYTVTVRNNCGKEKNGKVTISVENVTPTIGDITISGAGSFCKDTEITLSCNIAGEGTTYQWYKNNTSISGETNQTLTVIVKEDATYKVEVIKNTPCRVARISESVSIVALTRPEAPKFNPETQTVCAGAELTLPTPTNIGSYEISWSIKDAKNTPIVLPLNETTTFVATLSNNGCISEETEYTVNVNPLPVPVISADFEAVNVGETITLTVEGDNIKNIEWYATDGTKEYNVTEITAKKATITSDENAIITVTVTATSANDCVATTTKDVTFGSENCEVSNADYVEILCRTSDGKRDMYCYAWKDGTTVELLGGYPGQKTKDGEFEYKGVKYAVWQIKTDSKIDVIFGNGTTKTGDITGLEKGKRYVYTLTNYNTATLKETASNIFVPEVKTISVVPVRQQNGTIKVSLSGKIMKKGCTNISSYGFQYKKVGGDYTNIEVGTTDQDAGFVYTKEFTIPNQQYGEYVFRARLVNANSTKVYGEEIHVYYYESDAFIAVVGDDYDVTNKDDVYYDFVGLYVKNVVIPSGANISSYEWQVKESSQWVKYNNGEATVADRGVTAANNNIRPNEAGEYRCVITLSNGTRLESNVIEIKSTATYDEKITAKNRNLPVISVRTNVDFPTCETAGTTGNYPSTNIPGWKKKRSVDVKIFNADGSLYYDRKARMNYRGSSSLNFNKKSYAFCPGDENCGGEDGPDYVKTKKMNLFGLSSGAEDKDWVLYAASADPTLMRNRLVFDTYSEMTGKWGVNSMYVELVIDGKYQGVYVLMDKITNNTNRTYVGKYGNKDYTGGFIVKFDKTDIADRERSLLVGQELGDEKTFMTSRTGRLNIDTYHTKVDQLFEIEYPEKDDVEDEGESWSSVLGRIQQQFEEFETALANGDYIKVRSLINYQSWADWFIINEFTKNVDAYRASCIFTYKGEGHKIEALPLWDQELSFNNAAGANIGKKGANVTNGLLIEHNGVYTDCFPAPFWFTGRTSNFNTCGTDGGESTEGSKIENYLLKDECFVATIKERWKEHTKEGGALHKKQLTDKLDSLVIELGAAKDREIAKWPSDHRVADACGGPGTGYNDIDYATSYTALENWIKGDLTSVNAENASYNRVTNLNYLINKMEGEPLLFDLTVNPINGVTTPWIPVTITVEAPEGYEYTYDDSAIKAEKGVIIKHVGDKYSYTFPRPEAWPTGNVDTPIAPKFYEVEVKLNVSAVDNSCGGTFETDKKTTITLQDEGNDLCTYVEP